VKTSLLRKSRFLFPDGIWTPLSIVAVPVFVFDAGHKPVLTGPELCAYAIACEIAENPQANCAFTLSLSDLMKHMGLTSRPAVAKIRKSLERKRFIKREGARKGRDAQRYVLTNPRSGESFAVETEDKRTHQSLRSTLRHLGIGYLNVPLFAIQQISKSPTSSFALFVAVCRYLSILGERDGQLEASILRAMSGLDRRTFKKAIEALNGRWLDIAFSDSRTVGVILVNPWTQATLESFARTLKDEDDAAVQRSIHAQRVNTPEQLLAFAMWLIGDTNPKHSSGADFYFRCPECRNGKTHKPKFAFNPFRGTHGLFCCYDCGVGGGLKRLAVEKVGLFGALSKLAGIERSEPLLVEAATKMLKGYTESGYQKAS
jgi:DNA-binding MarR family transcriptional regulator